MLRSRTLRTLLLATAHPTAMTAKATPTDLGHMDDDYADLVAAARAAGDPLRSNILRVLQRDSFSVTELCRLFGISQPALSHHLKLLLSAGLVTNHREGTHIYYRRALHDASESIAAFASGYFRNLDQTEYPEELGRAIDGVHKQRDAHSREFFTANARRFAEQQALIATPGVYRDAAIQLLDASSAGRDCVLEVGPGDGDLLMPLAARFGRVVAVDDNPEMLDRASHAVSGADNIRFLHKRFQALAARRQYDAVVASMVIHHNPSPARFFLQAESILRASGILLVIELYPHTQEWVRDACGDLWLGFSEDQLDQWAQAAGLEPAHAQYLSQNNGFRIQLRTYRKD